MKKAIAAFCILLICITCFTINCIAEDQKESPKSKKKGSQENEQPYKNGNTYFAGLSRTKNIQSAITQWEDAASRGHVEAQYQLAVIYDAGLSGIRNPDKALKLYQMAAEKGLPKAQFVLAHKYIKGEGVEKDPAKGYHWAKIAAEHGDTNAQCLLSDIYARGKGVPADLVRAYIWCSEAMTRKQMRCPSPPEELAAELTADQRAQAEEIRKTISRRISVLTTVPAAGMNEPEE